jgi:hypothetical protein
LATKLQRFCTQAASQRPHLLIRGDHLARQELRHQGVAGGVRRRVLCLLRLLCLQGLLCLLC